MLVLGPAVAAGAEETVSVHAEEGGAGQAITLSTTKARQFTLSADVRDVVVADPSVADVLIKTPRLVYMIGNKVGDTNAIFLDAAGHQVLKLDIHVDRDLSALRAAIKELAPDADVKVESLNQDLVLSGDVPSAQTGDNVRTLARRFVEKDDNLVNLMKITGAQQVLIRVKVAEVRRSVTKQLGFNTFFQGRHYSFGTGSPSGSGLFSDSFGYGSSAGTGYGTASNPSVGSSVPLLGSGAANYPVVAAFSQSLVSIEALEQHALIKTLAEPNLTALSGEPATFLAGGEFPVPTGRDQYGQVTISFKPYGVSLSFTPVVLTNGRISLRIGTEVSELSTEAQVILADVTVPSLQVRRAQTTVEIPSGDTLMLGGLLRNSARNTVNGFPGIKDLPVLGALFRSNNYLSDETELMVFATPYVVRSTAPSATTSPTDRFAMPSDVDMYLFNGLYARYGGGKPEASPYGSHDVSSSVSSSAGQPVGYIMP
jgi:pilus assembly protein CpaC